MSVLTLEAVSQGELNRVSATFGEGRSVLLGTEADGTHTLLGLAAGLMLPRRGRVLLDGAAPAASCGVRRGIASLFAREALPPGSSVLGALDLALAARGDARSASSVLDAAGLASWARRRPAALSGRETRAIALAFALSHPEPALLALYEPLSLLGLLNEDFVLGVLARHHQAIVLCSASRAEDARKLGSIAGALVRGQWQPAEPERLRSNPVTLRVHSPDAQRLAAHLRGSALFTAVESAGAHELLVYGVGAEATARGVIEQARAEALRISALTTESVA